MFDFWSRYTKQPGHDDLHGRSASIEEDERLDSSTVRFSLDRFNYCRGLVATGYARISRYQIFFFLSLSSSRNHRSESSLSQRGMLDLPRRCTFLTRTFRLFLSLFLEGYRFYRYRSLRSSFFHFFVEFSLL